MAVTSVMAETRAIAGTLGIRIDHPRVEEINKLLAGLTEEFRDWRPAWRRIAKEVLLPRVAEAFSSKASPAGEAWAPNSPEYRKRKKGGLLEASGKLRKSLTKEGGGGKAVRKYGKKFALVGTDLGYALPLQWGYGKGSLSSTRAAARASTGTSGRRRSRSRGLRSDVPARPFIAWSPSMRVRASTVVLEHLRTQVEKQAAGFEKRTGRKGGR